MYYFDLHADTPYRIFHDNLAPDSPLLHASPIHASVFRRYRQVYACWADKNLSDDAAFYDVLDMYRHFKKTCSAYLSNALFSIEDGRILCEDIRRLELLKQKGFSLLTLQWQGENCIGGAWDTNIGLSAFGKQVVKACSDLDILMDVSHASHAVIEESVYFCKKKKRPLLATHSAAFSVCPHGRNLTDQEITAICQTDGLIGVPMVPAHLTQGKKATMEDVLDHVEHFLYMGAKNNLAIGSDFDGTSSLPEDLPNINAIPSLQKAMSKRFGADLTHAVMWENAARFFQTIY